MKLLIFLKAEYKHTASERAAAFKQFRVGLKQWSYAKLLKELEPEPQVIIEFPDDKKVEMYKNLASLDIVEIIDSIIPIEKKSKTSLY